MTKYASIEWANDRLRLLDQRQLPAKTVWLEYSDYQAVAAAIREMVVRGAVGIGTVAAYALAMAARQSKERDVSALRAELAAAALVLRTARPTAVNFGVDIDRVIARISDPSLCTANALAAAALCEADAIAESYVRTNIQMGIHALELVPDRANFIHHCNTGGLAALDYGTALGVIRIAHEHGKRVHVFVDETRPYLQGARLTAWELQQMGIPYTVIVDSAAAHIMRMRKIDLCVVGCDRVAANGDTANKIGTYHLALAAHAHGVPFYVVGATSSIDMSLASGDEIPIEERPAREVTHVGETQITPDGAHVANPAFDVTPSAYITAIITELGIARPPFGRSLAQQKAAAKGAGSS